MRTTALAVSIAVICIAAYANHKYATYDPAVLAPEEQACQDTHDRTYRAANDALDAYDECLTAVLAGANCTDAIELAQIRFEHYGPQTVDCARRGYPMETLRAESIELTGALISQIEREIAKRRVLR